MKITFILKNKTEDFYSKLSKTNDSDVFNWLNDSGIKPKIGNDTIKEKIDFNILLNKGAKFSKTLLENRKGYKLLTINLHG